MGIKGNGKSLERVEKLLDSALETIRKKDARIDDQGKMLELLSGTLDDLKEKLDYWAKQAAVLQMEKNALTLENQQLSTMLEEAHNEIEEFRYWS